MGVLKLSVNKQEPGIYMIKIQGELDLYSTNDVRNAVEECLQQPVPKLLIDVSELEYLDSSGVGLLINMIQSIKIKSGAIQVFGLHGSPRKVLEMSKILVLVPECSTIEQGITKLSNS